MYVDREYNEYCYMIIKRKSFENTFHFYFSAGFKLYDSTVRKKRRAPSSPPPISFSQHPPRTVVYNTHF